MSDITPTAVRPSLPPSAPPDPALERLRLLRGLAVDLAVLAAIVALSMTKIVSGDAAVALIAAIAGAGVVHKGGQAVSGKLAAGGAVAALATGLAGRGGDA